MKLLLKNSFIIIVFLSFFCFSAESVAFATLQYEEKAKRFVYYLSNEKYDSATADFDKSVLSALPPEKLKEIWQSLQNQFGRFKAQGRTMIEESGIYQVYFITCIFQNSSLDAKIVYKRNGQIAGLFFVPVKSEAVYKPPTYVNSKLFTEQEVTIGAGEWILPATFSIPKGKGPFPAVVLVHGSGPQDRDETIGPNKPFADIAWGLASKGIAVLRYEKRTKQYGVKISQENIPITVNEETIDDALSAVSFLRKSEKINPRKVFVLGHSLGGMLAPRIGQRDLSIAGLIIMGGITRPLEDIIIEQMNYIFLLDGKINDAEQNQLDNINKQISRVKDPLLSSEISPTELPFGVHAEYWLDLRKYDPAKSAENLLMPMLILQGERDYQVTMDNFNGWKQRLITKKNVAFKVYPTLNHLFMDGIGKSTPDEYEKEGHVAEFVIEDIAQWILKH